MLYTKRQIKKEAKNYKGWDWTEVYEKLGIDYADPPNAIEDLDKADEEVYKRLRDEIQTVYEFCYSEEGMAKMPERQKQILLTCRAYTGAATKQRYTYRTKLWQGLVNMESDEEFLTFFSLLFPFMWE
jgi:hypothetical protein